MAKRTNSGKNSKKPLDRFSATRGRGRRENIRPSEVYGRSEHFRFIFNEVWDRLWPSLSQAANPDEVTKAFQESARPYNSNFVPIMSGLVLQVLRERRFPKRRDAQVGFLADSLAGVGVITPRRARDICERERAKRKRAHQILRYEYYIECSCGYKGVSHDHACPTCKAEINFGFGSHLARGI